MRQTITVNANASGWDNSTKQAEADIITLPSGRLVAILDGRQYLPKANGTWTSGSTYPAHIAEDARIARNAIIF